jgi:outer membrane cobalamin receptor
LTALRLISILLLILLGTWIGKAQTNLWDTVRINEIRVAGKLKSSAIKQTKIDSVELQNNASGDLATLMSRSAPVFIKTAAPGSLATISMRGTLASHTRVNWNGIQLNSPMLGQVDFTLIPTFLTDQVMISSGPGSVLKGAGAMGGQIDLSSQGRWDKKFFGSLLSSVGSFSTYRWMSDIGGSKGPLQLRLRVYRSQSQNDFPFLNTANGLFNEVRQQNADYRIQGLLAQMQVRPNTNLLYSSSLWLQHSNRNLPPIMSYEGSGRTEYQIDKMIRWAQKGQYRQGDLSVTLSSGLSVANLEYRLQHNTGGGILVNYNIQSASFSSNNKLILGYQVNPKHLLSATLNSDFYLVDIQDEKNGTGYAAQRFENGIQLQGQQAWNNRLHSYLSLQQGWTGKDRNPIVPGVGLSYSIIPKLFEINLSGARNYKIPTLNDLHWIPGGNPDLLPEEGYLGDIGIRSAFHLHHNLTLDYEMTGFASYIENWILWKPGEYQYWSPENLETVFARGLETSLDVSGEWSQSKLQLRTNYTFTRTNQLGETAAFQLMYIPIHKATAFLLGEIGQWYGHYNYLFTSERFTSTGEEASLHRLPAYSIHDLSLGRKFNINHNILDIRLTICNLFDNEFQSILWRAMPGRYYTLFMKFDF